MYLNSILVCLLSLRVVANTQRDFIIDYFKYTTVSSVVGFTCNNEIDDVLMIKGLNEIGVTTALHKFKNDSLVSILAYTDRMKVGIFLDTNCYKSENYVILLLQEASTYWMFDALRFWLILGSNYTAVLNVIEDRSFGASTNFIVAISIKNDKYKLYDAYNIFKDRGTKLNITFYGDWEKENGMNIVINEEKFARRKHLNGIFLKAAYFKMTFKPNNTDFEDYLIGENYATRDGQSKFGHSMLSYLAQLYNFSLKSYEMEKWQKNDRLGPVARALAESKVDFTGSPININSQRLKLMKFVHSDWPFRTCFIFRNPQPTTIKVQEIFRPLANETWFLSILLIIASITILFMVLTYEKVETNLLKLSNSVLLSIGSLCQQSTNMEMHEFSTRIAFLFIMIFSLLIYNYYSASVVSARLAEPIFKINDSLTELGKMQLKMASELMPYLEFFLKQPDWETRTFYQKYWLLLPEPMWYMNPENGLRLVQKGGFAYHVHPNVAYPVIEKLFQNHEICELMEVHLGRPTFVTFGVHFNSTIVEVTRVGLCKVAEVGLRHRQVLRYKFRKPKCRTDTLSATSINIYEFAPHLILLFVGMIVAIVLFVFELLMHDHGTGTKKGLLIFMK